MRVSIIKSSIARACVCGVHLIDDEQRHYYDTCFFLLSFLNYILLYQLRDFHTVRACKLNTIKNHVQVFPHWCFARFETFT